MGRSWTGVRGLLGAFQGRRRRRGPSTSREGDFVLIVLRLRSYAFDIVYVTWAVHVLAALVTAKAWYIYWVVRSVSFRRHISLLQALGLRVELVVAAARLTTASPPADPALRPLPPRIVCPSLHLALACRPTQRLIRLDRRSRTSRWRSGGRPASAGEQAAAEVAQADGEGRPAGPAAGVEAGAVDPEAE